MHNLKIMHFLIKLNLIFMKFYILLVAFLSSPFIFSQQKNISGTIVDETGFPLAAVEVISLPSQTKSETNLDGVFKISVPDSDKQIKITDSNNNSKTVTISNKVKLNIVFENSKSQEADLKEVIVTSSYGTKKLKEEIVGSISTISAKEIQTNQSFESVDKMIQGLSPGVQISAGSELGKPVSINIRGLGSLSPLNSTAIGTSTQPLIIIDGIIMSEDRAFDNEFFDGGGNAATILNNLARINPDNIESINILKDAAAVGLYGANAANGVIIITTKKGGKGGLRFNTKVQYGVNEAIHKIKYLSGQEYSNLYNEYKKNLNQTQTPWNGVDVDWFEILNKTGSFHNINFGMSGGLKNISYNASINYQKTKEAQIGNELEKINGDLTIGYSNEKFSINFGNSVSQFTKTAPNKYYSFVLAPTFSIYDEDDNYAFTGTKGIGNPLAAIEQNTNDSKTTSWLSSINISYSPITDLKISGIFGLDYSDRKQIDWYSGENESGIKNGSFVSVADGKTYFNNGISRLNYSNTFKWNSSITAYYEKNIKENHFDLLVGLELRSEDIDKIAYSASGFIDYKNYQLPWDEPAKVGANKQTFAKRTLTNKETGRSLFSQFNYDYKKKYFFLANMRRDESSAFGSDNNVAWNGGMGMSWVISNEKFLQSKTWLDFLRLRTSWGLTGNSRIGSYRSAGLYNVTLDTGYNGGDYANPISSAPENGRLGWEKNEKYNVGIDVGIFKFLDFTVEVFRNNLSDLIVSRSIPTETGYSSVEINGSDMYNQGIEFSFNAQIFKKKNFTWNTKFNIAKVENEITSLTGFGQNNSTSAIARSQRIGTSTSAIWGWVWDKVDPTTGRNQYIINENSIDDVTLATNYTSADWQIIGNSQPDFFGGMQHNFTLFQNFSVGFMFNFEFGSNILIEDELLSKYTNLLNRNLSVNALDHWSEVGDIAKYAKVDNKNRLLSNNTNYVYDLSNIKLQSLNLAYNLPFNNSEKSIIRTANIFCNITNVFYWYKSSSPEGRNGVRELRYKYPEMRTISLGFSLTF